MSRSGSSIRTEICLVTSNYRPCSKVRSAICDNIKMRELTGLKFIANISTVRLGAVLVVAVVTQHSELDNRQYNMELRAI